MHTILAGPAMQPSPNGGIAPPAIDSILSATLLAPDGFRFWRVGPPLPGCSTARIVAALCWIARLLLGPFHGPYRRRARLDAVRIVVSSATRNAGSYTCVSTGSAGCREITPPLAGPTPGPVNPGPPAGTLRTSLHILTTPTAKVRPA